MHKRIAGLWAARAASDHFENVIIIEPEAWAGSELGKSNPFSAKGTRIQANNTPPRTRISQYTNALHCKYDLFTISETHTDLIHRSVSACCVSGIEEVFPRL